VSSDDVLKLITAVTSEQWEETS